MVAVVGSLNERYFVDSETHTCRLEVECLPARSIGDSVVATQPLMLSLRTM